MKMVKPSVELVTATPFALLVIEEAGRTCYKSDGKCKTCLTGTCPECLGRAERFIRSIIRRGHESVLEHASATFRIVCDRGVTHELVRHRIASYSQESTRYCDYSKGVQFIMPDEFEDDIILRDKYLEFCAVSEGYYKWFRERGLKPQVARHVLPIGVKTEIVMTSNFREWRHILRLRTAADAHPHIRQVMDDVGCWFRENYPVILEGM